MAANKRKRERVRVRPKRTRVRLLRKTRADDSAIAQQEFEEADGRPLIVSGYGAMIGQFLIGRLLRKNDEYAVVGLRDDDGTYEELYRLSDGTRTSDVLLSDGWCVQPSELGNAPDVNVDRPQPRDLKLLHRELLCRTESGVDEVMEVWAVDGVHYLNAYRQHTTAKRKRTRRRSLMLPFSELKRVLVDFEVEW